MNPRWFLVVAFVLAGSRGVAQTAPQGGRGAQNNPPAGAASVRPPGSSLGTIRLGAQDEKIWFGWHVGIPATAFRGLTFSDAAAKADALGLGSIEGFDTQKVSPEVPKNLTWRLGPGERNAILNRLRDVNVKMYAYHVEKFEADPATQRKVFELAKALGVAVIVTPDPAAADLAKVADEFGINVAIENSPPLDGRGKRIGWMHGPTQPAGERTAAISVRDATAAGLSDFFLAAFRSGVKNIYIRIEPTGGPDTFADLFASVRAWEKAMQRTMMARVNQMLDSPEGKIRGGDRLSADLRAQIDAVIPRQPLVKPKKPRKLLVTDIQMYSGHGSIPHGNYMLELMAKYTGAFEPTFSNDLANLKYPKIKEFDAVFLNNVCGMTFPDPEVREGLLRYVREGGGLGGNHAVTFSNNDWPEFMEMLGAWAGAHHTETQVIKIDDASSPLTKSFGSASFEHNDEFYHFPSWSPYTREKQHVLLSLDVEKSDMATQGKFCAQCTREDHDYALAWIKSYGKGRVYATPLGHTNPMYTDKRWVAHVLAAVQFILGDLEADTTPSAHLSKQGSARQK